jgi:ferredoxin/predicted CopG family antitoxin
LVTEKERNQISINDKAYERLNKAKKKGESFSDVVIRLSDTKVTALQRRGQMEIATSDGRRFSVEVDQDRCVGAESCVVIAPDLFALDPSELGGFRRGAAPLGMREVEDNSVDSEKLITASKSCPYHAIHLTDARTGEEIGG